VDKRIIITLGGFAVLLLLATRRSANAQIVSVFLSF